MLELYDKCLILYYLNRHHTMQSTVLTQLGKVVYHNYKLHHQCIGINNINNNSNNNTNNDKRYCIFNTKHIFDEYYDSLQLLSTFEESSNSSNMNEIQQTNAFGCIQTARKS